MRAVCVIIGVLLLPLSMLADDRSSAVLKQLEARVDALGDYHVVFEVRAEDNVLRGSYAVSGDRYNMHTDEYDVLCDGHTRWEVHHADREVLVDRVDPGSGSILTNPTRAFDFAPEAFESTMRGANVVLTPRDRASAIKSIEVVLAPATGLPAEVRYRQEGLRGEVVVRVVSLGSGLPEGARFTFDKGRHKGYEVVDFR